MPSPFWFILTESAGLGLLLQEAPTWDPLPAWLLDSAHGSSMQIRGKHRQAAPASGSSGIPLRGPFCVSSLSAAWGLEQRGEEPVRPEHQMQTA